MYHTLTRHDAEKHGDWDGLQGRVSYEMLQECQFPEAADDVFIGICGPPEFNAEIAGFLQENGYVKGEHFM